MFLSLKLCANPAHPDEYRLRPMYFWLGAGGMILYGAIDAFFFQLAYYNADGSFPFPEAMAAFSACFWGFWVLLSLFLLLAGWRHCLRPAGDALVDQGILFQRRIRFKDVAVIEWRALSKSISIRGDQTHIRIYLTSIPAAQQKRLINFVRTTFPLEIQKDWKQFDQCQKEPHLVQRIPSRGMAVVCICILLGFYVASSLRDERFAAGKAALRRRISRRRP